ncbi:hypothetical protein C8R43DRAFT_960719 [Mycena crocata]|nr:hypothetical protein C8R43DRAFT_960719 [Mycena crocata]
MPSSQCDKTVAGKIIIMFWSKKKKKGEKMCLDLGELPKVTPAPDPLVLLRMRGNHSAVQYFSGFGRLRMNLSQEAHTESNIAQCGAWIRTTTTCTFFPLLPPPPTSPPPKSRNSPQQPQDDVSTSRKRLFRMANARRRAAAPTNPHGIVMDIAKGRGSRRDDVSTSRERLFTMAPFFEKKCRQQANPTSSLECTVFQQPCAFPPP